MSQARPDRASRWPLHPQPGPNESLSSWLGRLALLYGLSAKDLLTGNLGLPGLHIPWGDPDISPPAPMLAALSERTGTGLDRLRAMTLAGWVPWLFDTYTVSRHNAQEMFDTYVRANPVLLAPGEAGTHQVLRWKSWSGPWIPRYPLLRTCPACAAGPAMGSALMWRLPLIVSCADHGCMLIETVGGDAALIATGCLPAPVPVPEPLATLDSYTHEAIATGLVALPGRIVHAGVWFRLLRSLLDELSLATSTVSMRGGVAIRQVWDAAGHPERGGLNIWESYEQMRWETQQVMLHAAATALHLIADRTITPRGFLGSALHPPHDQYVYDGDQPGARPDAWLEVMLELGKVVRRARTDAGTARQLLTLMTTRCQTLTQFKEERACLFGAGIPAEFLPGPRELGRADLA